MNTRTGQEILLVGAGEKNTAKSSTYTEALAILAASVALSGCDLTIYTDSQCGIDTFRNLPDLALEINVAKNNNNTTTEAQAHPANPQHRVRRSQATDGPTGLGNRKSTERTDAQA